MTAPTLTPQAKAPIVELADRVPGGRPAALVLAAVLLVLAAGAVGWRLGERAAIEACAEQGEVVTGWLSPPGSGHVVVGCVVPRELAGR